METPRIDAVLHQYKKRYGEDQGVRNSSSTIEVASKDEYGERLRLLETQLAGILRRNKASQALLKLQARM